MNQFLLCIITFFLLLLVSPVSSKNVGVVVFPEAGHFHPVVAVMEQLLQRGHHVFVYVAVAERGAFDCQRETADLHPPPTCVEVGIYNSTFVTPEYITTLVEDSFFGSLTEITREMDRYNFFLAKALHTHLKSENAEKMDVFMVDFGAYSGSIVGEALGVPSVMVWPLVLQFPVQSHASIPALTLAQSIHMTRWERFVNYAMQRLLLLLTHLSSPPNDIRASLGVPPVDIYELYQRRHIISPAIFGLDIAQPLCPNVHPVGFLTRGKGATLPADGVPAEWQKWLNECTGGVVYVNMGSVARMPDAWTHKLEEGVHSLVHGGFCVLWKLHKEQHPKLKHTVPKAGPLRLSAHIPFTPRYILKHENTKVFVTHCGDTSVYETVEFGVPMVGIPLFADQADMCARVEDAGVGRRLNKFTFTGESLKAAVLAMASDPHAREKAARIAKMGLIQGGSGRAADVVEMVGNHPELATKYFCPHYDLPWYEHYDVDVTVILSLVLFVLLCVIGAVVKCCLRCCCRRGKKGENKKASGKKTKRE